MIRFYIVNLTNGKKRFMNKFVLVSHWKRIKNLYSKKIASKETTHVFDYDQTMAQLRVTMAL